MSAGLPGVDVKLLVNVTRRLTERRLHAYYPGSRRSAAALVLRFDDATQRTLTAALSQYRAETRDSSLSSLTSSSSSTAGQRIDPLELLDFVEHRCVDAAAPSSLRLLFLKRADMDASRWSGQVAFPGGRRDPEDADDFHTVCRAAEEEMGLPLRHHREFVLLGRLPDFKLRSRAVNTLGLVQARYVFLHVGDMTPSLQLARHEVQSVRWMPLSRLAAAHVEHGCVAHPLQSFVHPQDADYRLLLNELFPSTYLTFPSVSLPHIDTTAEAEHPASSSGASTSSTAAAGVPSWRVWGLTLRTANELLALDNRQPFDWPLVESNSRLFQLTILFPFHGYYEVLYQWYWWRAWAAARLRRSVTAFRERWGATCQELPPKHRHVLYGSSMDRRYAVLPLTADPLLFAVPEQPVPAHVACILSLASAVVLFFYSVASFIAVFFAAVGMGLRVERTLDREEQQQRQRQRQQESVEAEEKTRSEEGVTHGEESAEPSTVTTLPAAADWHASASTSPTTSSSSSSWWKGGKSAEQRASESVPADEAALAAALGVYAVPTASTTAEVQPATMVAPGGATKDAPHTGEASLSVPGSDLASYKRTAAETTLRRQSASASPAKTPSEREKPSKGGEPQSASLREGEQKKSPVPSVTRAADAFVERSHEDDLEDVMQRYRSR